MRANVLFSQVPQTLLEPVIATIPSFLSFGLMPGFAGIAVRAALEKAEQKKSDRMRYPIGKFECGKSYCAESKKNRFHQDILHYAEILDLIGLYEIPDVVVLWKNDQDFIALSNANTCLKQCVLDTYKFDIIDKIYDLNRLDFAVPGYSYVIQAESKIDICFKAHKCYLLFESIEVIDSRFLLPRPFT